MDALVMESTKKERSCGRKAVKLNYSSFASSVFLLNRWRGRHHAVTLISCTGQSTRTPAEMRLMTEMGLRVTLERNGKASLGRRRKYQP